MGMKLLTILGTRPNFTKEYAIHHICDERGINKVSVPQYANFIIKGPHGYETATILAYIEQVLLQEKPDVMLVYGDVNSTMAGALAAVKLGIPVAHIEAGLRTPNAFYNPEEINRRVTDSCAEILFPHIKEANEALIKEGYPKDRIFFHGDIVKDSVLRILKQKNIIISSGDFILCTIHRAENTNSQTRLQSITEALLDCGKRIKFPIHPRTKNFLIEYGLMKHLQESNRIELLPPLGYIEFIKLLAACDKFITDSGSARREAYILEKPVIVPIDIIWVKEMIECGWSRVALSKEEIVHAILNHSPEVIGRPEIFGDGMAAERIVQTILECYN